MQIREATVLVSRSCDGIGSRFSHVLFVEREAGVSAADLRLREALLQRSSKATGVVQDLQKGIGKPIAIAETEPGDEEMNDCPSKSAAFDGMEFSGWHEPRPGLNFKCFPAIPTPSRSDAWI